MKQGSTLDILEPRLCSIEIGPSSRKLGASCIKWPKSVVPEAHLKSACRIYGLGLTFTDWALRYGVP